MHTNCFILCCVATVHVTRVVDDCCEASTKEHCKTVLCCTFYGDCCDALTEEHCLIYVHVARFKVPGVKRRVESAV